MGTGWQIDNVLKDNDGVLTDSNPLPVKTISFNRDGVTEHFKRDLATSTTIDVNVAVGATVIPVAVTTGIVVGTLVRIYDTTVHEPLHFKVTAISVGVSITLDRPIDKAFAVGDNVTVVEINMNKGGTLATPISYKIKPSTGEVYELTRILISMLDSSAMDDSLFGAVSELTNGVTLRKYESGVFSTLANWKSNSDMIATMYDINYSSKAAAGKFGLAGRWTFAKSNYVIKLDGSNGDYLELLVQDSLTGLDNFIMNAQGSIV